VDSATVFSPQRDTDRVFLYVVPSLWSGCPPDSALVRTRVATALPDLGKDTVLCKDKSLKLRIPLLPEYASVAWSTGGTGSSITVNAPGEYAVTVTSEVGNCVFSDTVKVEYVNCVPCNIYVPNVFAPDDDGENDWFQGYSDCAFLSYHLRVYDRWGNMVFQSRKEEDHWDGTFRSKAMSPGVFIWLLDVETEYLGKAIAQRLQGDVTIVK
jgi:large repetitive protein